MEYQSKQLFRGGSCIRIVGFKLVAIMALTLLLLIIGTCCLQTSSSSAHAHGIEATSVLAGSRADVILPPVGLNSTLRVYFSKSIATGGPWGATFALKRADPVLNHVGSAGIIAAYATYAMQELVAGPTRAEVMEGYTSMVHQSLFGRSTCGGQQNFILTLDEKGASPMPGTATIRLCRQISSAGVGTDVGIRAEIGSTLKQFTSIKNVVILLSNGHCFGDESGADFCLR
jgi:hypothetical protein